MRLCVRSELLLLRMDRGEKIAHTIFWYKRMNSIPVLDGLIKTCSDGRRLFLRSYKCSPYVVRPMDAVDGIDWMKS